MAYSYGLKNAYRPTKLAPNAYAWSTHPGYNGADVPHGLMDRPADITTEQFKQQFAYEWFESRDAGGFTNPPFVSGAAGRLLPMLRNESGGPAKILRGYIRRASFDDGDDRSKARLYFMYNPEIIQRDYVSYLNQTALDPFNTVYGSANDVAPPSFMDFSFSLFFDRQEEATDANHPGVFVDYQYFDLVVRNVTPDDPNQSNNTLPDNGVMMVNPKDITVVFSPQITVQGRPLNASVRFEKFTHRMVPTRMWITLTMRVIYIGPVKEMTEYKAEEMQAEASIFLYSSTRDEYQAPASAEENDATNSSGWDDLLPATREYLERMYGTAEDGSDLVRQKALNWCYQNVNQGVTKYMKGNPARTNLPVSADCSGLVSMAYRGAGVADEIGWHLTDTESMWQLASNPNNKHFYLTALTEDDKFNWRKDLRPGDVLWRKGHTGFFVKYTYPGGTLTGPLATGMYIFDASGPGSNPQVGERPNNMKGNWTHMIRVINVGSSSSVSASTTWKDNMAKTAQVPR